jgi:SAM-dependent methyltransferase
MRRSVDVEELLDGPLDDDAALRGNLRDLERANRWLGGVTLSAHGIDALAGGRDTLTVLDIGTGAADIPVALLARAAGAGHHWRITGIDSRPEVLAAAVVRRPSLRDTAGLQLQVGDGVSLPFPNRSFDIAHASLLVHHLDPPAAVVLFREMNRVARHGIVVNDLRRGRGAWLGAWLLSRLTTRNRYTRNDAPLSVRRAYSVGELTALIAAAGLRVRSVRIGGPLGHRVVLAATAGPGTPA